MNEKATGKRRKRTGTAENSERARAYRRLRHPFAPQAVFSADAIESIHQTALRALETLGVKIALAEARELLRKGGASADEDSQIVKIGREMVEGALASAPKSFRLRAACGEREQMFENGAMIFSGSGGCPNVTDLKNGRRAGSLETYEDAIKLQQSFDVIHVLSPAAEPQDVPVNYRHYAMMETQLALADKPVFVYARGRGQVRESFELAQIGLGLSHDEFIGGVWTKTVVNTNSPRLLDAPMAQAIIDFARTRQLCIMTPFCLAGAMAPITIAGALALQHAEALACITLSQTAQAGAPVAYGGFSSNVDMKSGAPAFGTPEHVKLSIGSGQLARHIGLPWRSAAGSSSNISDAQGASENAMGLWGAMMANATLVLHSAGWLEGGLTFGFEKFVNDVETLQMIAELCKKTPDDEGSLAWEALEAVEPAGHFFGTKHTLERYKDAFYAPLVADLSNFETWREKGALTATERAADIWQAVLRDFEPPSGGADAKERIQAYIEKGKAKGGAMPLGT